MREIEFRQWVNGKAYSWGVGVDGCQFVSPTSGSRINAVNTIHEQYTGLKDCNGVKIFEADIFYEMSTGGKGVVSMSEYDDSEQYEHKCHLGWHVNGNPLADIASKGEVIGNIHQHPHLLEGKE